MGILGAATLSAKGAFGFFRKKEPLPQAPIGPPLQGEPHKSVCYVYNAGMDFEGIQGHTFGKYAVIPGGKVSRIEQCEEHTFRGLHDWHVPGRSLYSQPGRFARYMGVKPRKVGYEPSEGERKQAAGLYRVERVKTGRSSHLDYDSLRHTHPGLANKYYDAPETLTDAEWDHINTSWYEEDLYEDRFVIVHPAREIADNLAESASYHEIVRLPFWDDKSVDLEWVNKLIAAETLEERIAKVSALRDEKETSLLRLRVTLLSALGVHAKKLRRWTATNIVSSTHSFSRFETRAAILLGVSYKDMIALRRKAEFGSPLNRQVEWIEQSLPLWKA